jgi:hypothetical protein
MRRFVTLAVLLLFTVPFGVSISGCSKATSITYCNGLNSGVQVGQTVTLDLEPRLTGISINQGAIGSIGAPTGKDCKGSVSSVTGTVYASTDRTIVDVNPVTGSGGLCAGTWNRNSGNGVADYTICTPNGKEGTAYITASAQGVVSNPVAVYVHPVVTSIILGTASTDCTIDPASNCYAPNAQACSTGPITSSINPYPGTACVSQGTASQLAARVFAGTGAAQQNISCLVGPLAFTAQTPAVVTIDTNGVATATQPGSTIINAAISKSSSTAGSFSTCPPASIVLSAAGTTTPPTGPLTVAQNVTQQLVATVLDTNNVPLNNISLTYVSTTPVTIPTSLNDITPTFPGAAAITAICQPPTCNPSAFDQIGLFGNGTPVFSEPVQIDATGTNNSTVLYIASTQSQYLLPIDFTVTTQASPVRLPYVPNSLVLSVDGSTIYMGTNDELMVYSTTSNALTKQDTTVSGLVLTIAPNNGTIVITDPIRQLTYLYGTASGGVITQYGGVATQAQFTPDSSTVYITTSDNRMLAYSTFTGWYAVGLQGPAPGVAVTIPNAGVYLAGNTVDVRSNCPVTTVVGSAPTQTSTNVFYPDQGPVAGALAPNPVVPGAIASYNFPTNNIASTNDGLHELAASTTAFTDIVTNQKQGACTAAQPGDPVITFSSAAKPPIAFTTAVPTAITNVLPTSDSTFAFITYTGTGGVVPQYAPATGILSNITLQTTTAGAPVAPVAGVVSSDNQTFYVGTTGDNLVHRLTRGASGFSDTLTPLIPGLPNINGTGVAIPNLIAQKPRKATS